MFFKQASSISSSIENRDHKDGLKNLFLSIFLTTVFLIPLVFYPGVVGLSYSVKIAFLSTLGALSIIAFLLNILGTGEIEFPKTKLIPILLLLPLVAILSTLVSGNFKNALVGNVFEVGTAGSFIILFIIFIISALAGFSDSAIKKTIKTFLVSSGIVALYTLVLSLMQSGLLPVVKGLPLSIIGSYIDLSIFLGASTVLSLCYLNLYESSNKFKIYLYCLLVASVLIVGAVSFTPVIASLGVFTLLIFVYLISVSRDNRGAWIRKSYSTLLVLIATIVMIISGGGVGTFLSGVLKINSFDVRPNFESTLTVVKSEWAHNPITGAGPNRFNELWSLYKQVAVNQTDFWNTDFFFGSGLFMTLAATLGALGVIALLLFFVMYMKSGFKAFFVQTQENQEFVPGRSDKRFFAVATFLTSIFLWLSIFFYSPGIIVLVFAFIWSGMFVASLKSLNIIQNAKINIFSNPKANFVSVFLVVVLMVSTVSLEYFVWEKIVASFFFNKAVAQFNIDSNIERARVGLEKAINIYPTDSYQRSLAQLHLLNIERIISTIPQSGNIPETTRVELQNSIASAIQFAQGAIKAGPNNYQNHLIKVSIYESLATKGIAGAAESAKESIITAQALSPMNPSIPLISARIAAISGDLTQAKTSINRAIELKSNYTDAYFLLAQLEAASNNSVGAIKAVESATLIDPLNAGLFFQLGLLKYQTSDNAGAVEALSRAVSIVPDYANAKYFLGLAYYRLGQTSDAIAQFESIKVTNPNNQEIDLILKNLNAGKDPFTGAKPPVDNKPEKRASPPLPESSAN